MESVSILKPALFLVAVAIVLAGAAPLGAATFIVTNTDSSGTGSLRTAIFNANAASDDDVIVFDLPGPGPHVIGILSPYTITAPVSILNDRSGDEVVTIQRTGSQSYRILLVETQATVTLAGLTMSNGNLTAIPTPNSSVGGGIRNNGFLILRNCTLSGNAAQRGGAIGNFGALSVQSCTFSGNTAATDAGGGLYTSGLGVQMINVTLSGNSAGTNGGGIFHASGSVSLINCTLSGNAAAAGGAVHGFGSLSATNTIFRTGASGGNIAGSFTSLGTNLSDDAAGGDGGTGPGGALSGTGDIRNTNPQLDVLADNGGFTRTHALMAGSPALNVGNDERAPSVDQRNFTRAGVSDIGAFERGGMLAPPYTSMTRTVTNTNDSGAGSLRAILASAQDGDTIAFAPNLTGVVTLTSGQLLIDQSVSIIGPGAAALSVDGNNNSRVFEIRNDFLLNHTVTISGLTIRGGRAQGIPNSTSGLGGGISSRANLTLQDCVVSRNVALGADATADAPSNSATGGGIYSLRPLTLSNTVVTGNLAVGGSGVLGGSTSGRLGGAGASGGGLYHSGATLTLTNSVVIDNEVIGGNGADGSDSGGALGGSVSGAGMRHGGGNLIVSNSALLRNAARAGNGGAGGAGTSGSDGGAGGSAEGGGLHGDANDAVSMTLTDVTVTGNTAEGGKGGNRGANSGVGLFGGNASGAGIFTVGTATLSRCTFNDNSALGGLGGQGGGNGGNGFGGAIHSDNPFFASALSLTNCTITGNSAIAGAGGPNNGSVGFGGGIRLNNGGFAAAYSTIANNVAGMNGTNAFGVGTRGGNLHLGPGATSTLTGIIAASGTAMEGPDVWGSVAGESNFNLIGDGTGLSGITHGSNSNQIGTTAQPINPMLGPLQDNGGPTFTRALLSGSPAINAGNDATAPSTDQRGYYRSGTSDVGAFEFNGSATPPPPPVLGNISTRMRVETGDNVLIGGFIITGTQPKKVMVRAVGPSLPLSGRLANPTLELHGPSGLLASNDNWQDASNAQEITDSTIAPSHQLESAILTTLPANSTGYTAIVRGVSGGTGVGLVEVYDLDRTVDSKLANISSRGFVQTGDDVMIGGFIIIGTGAHNVIVRAIGPSLPVSGKLADPILELFDQNGAMSGSNDTWRSGGQEAAIIASGVAPTNDLESTLIVTLPPAPHTVIVRGNNGTGVGLVEVYSAN